MKHLISIAALSCLLFISCNGEKIRTANPDSSPEARNLLDFIYEIKGEYILSGQHNFISTGSKYTEIIKEQTGKYPIVWGSDFSFVYEGDEPIRFLHCGPINLPDPDTIAGSESIQSLKIESTGLTSRLARQRLVETAIAKHREGYIISLMWHACPPGYGDSCNGEKIWTGEKGMSAEEWDRLTTEGTRLNNAWKVQADSIAFYLKQLKEAGVPVLWRPYHEMNGEWFWWGGHSGVKGFKKLWIMMYDYYVHQYGLDNLIWVWNPNAPRDIEDDRAYPYEAFWPGAEYVDVLALNVYRDDWNRTYYDDLIRLGGGKPIAIGTAAPPPESGVIESQTEWTWFMTWGNRVLWGNGIDRFNELFRDGRTLALGDVRIRDGSYVIRR